MSLFLNKQLSENEGERIAIFKQSVVTPIGCNTSGQGKIGVAPVASCLQTRQSRTHNIITYKQDILRLDSINII
jgi:hypothetical protein